MQSLKVNGYLKVDAQSEYVWQLTEIRVIALIDRSHEYDFATVTIQSLITCKHELLFRFPALRKLAGSCTCQGNITIFSPQLDTRGC
jgi:hypothetical protein